MAGTMLGKAVNFDSSRELRPTPNTSIFVPKFEVAVYNCKMLYSSPRPHMQRNRLFKKKKNLLNPFSQRQANHMPAHSRTCTLGGV